MVWEWLPDKPEVPLLITWLGSYLGPPAAPSPWTVYNGIGCVWLPVVFVVALWLWAGNSPTVTN